MGNRWQVTGTAKLTPKSRGLNWNAPDGMGCYGGELERSRWAAIDESF